MVFKRFMKHFSIAETDAGSKPIVHNRHCFLRQHLRKTHGQASVVARNIASEIEGNVATENWKGDESCFVETGFGKAAMAKGNFYTEPDPVVNMRWPKVSRIWHWSKILFEKYWLWRRI